MTETTETTETTELKVTVADSILAERETEEEAAARGRRELAQFTKRRSKKKKWLIFAAVVVAIVAGWKLLTPKPTPPPLDTVSLTRQKLTNTVSLTGVVESAEGGKVFSKSAATVNKVNVKVGDVVTAGDVLAVLDTEDLEISIASQRASMNLMAKKSEINLSAAEKDLADTTTDLEKNMDSNLALAEQTLKNAQRQMNDARIDLNENKDSMNAADDIVNGLEKKLNRASDAYNTAKEKWEAAKKANGGSEIGLDPAIVKEYDDTEKAFMDLNKEYKAALDEAGTGLSGYTKEYRRAREAYESALTSRNIAEEASKRRVDSLQDTIKLNELGSDLTTEQLALKKLEKQLADAVLVAPISGTVTAVNPKEGEPCPTAGVAFVVENTDKLIVKSKIKEYDVSAVKEGMVVTIKSDATGEEMFDGKVDSISPTAVKGADGSTNTTGGVEFATDISVVSKDTGLRVGVNTRMNVTLAEKENVFAVPFDTVTADATGQKIVYVAKADAEGKMIAKAIPVTTGLETSFNIEISGDALAEGDLIILSPLGIVADSVVNVALPQAAGVTDKAADGTGATMAMAIQ